MRGTAVMGLTPAYVALACICGALLSASSYLMKSPPEQREDTEGRARLEAFIAGTEQR